MLLREPRHCGPCLFLYIGGLEWSSAGESSPPRADTGTENRLAYYSRSSRTLPGAHSTPVARREALPRRRRPGLAAVGGGAGLGANLACGDKPQFFRTSDPKPTFKKALSEAFPWTVPSSHPPLSMTFSGGRAGGEEGTSEDRRLVRTGVPSASSS